MLALHITTKQVNNFIETNINNFDSIQSFRNEIDKTIAELDDGTNPNQIRFYKRVKEVLAVFVDEEENDKHGVGKCFSCYAHLGQHSICSESFLRENCREATEEEYKDLFNELTNLVGYNLNVL